MTEKDAIYLAIGHIATSWGTIDFTLDGLIQIIRTYDDAPSNEFLRSLASSVSFVTLLALSRGCAHLLTRDTRFWIVSTGSKYAAISLSTA